MIVNKIEQTLKNGRKYTFRSAEPEDAAEVLAVYNRIVAETEFSLSYPDEVSFTEENERDFLELYANDEGSLFLIAEIDGEIVGNVCFSAVGVQRKVSHRCTMSIAVVKKSWGMGVGSTLLDIAVDQAKNFGYEQMELSVASKNVRAIKLYEKSGFQATGRVPNSFRFDDKSYDDEIFMVKEL